MNLVRSCLTVQLTICDLFYYGFATGAAPDSAGLAFFDAQPDSRIYKLLAAQAV